MKKLNYILLVLFILVANLVFAQEQIPDSTLRVITKFDGTEYIGKIISDDGREVLISTDILGKIYIPKSDITSIINVKFIIASTRFDISFVSLLCILKYGRLRYASTLLRLLTKELYADKN